MADTKISALSAGTALGGTEKIPTVQGGANVYHTPEQFAGAMIHPGYVATRWYTNAPRIGAGIGGIANVLRVIPFMVPSRMTISDLGVRITTASASGHIRLGIYASDATTKMPTGAVLSSCVVATDATGTISAALGANVALTPGLYWWATLADNTTVVCNGVDQSTGVADTPSLIGATSLADLSNASTNLVDGYSVTGQAYASGAPNATGLTYVETVGVSMPAIFFKVASVP